MTQPANISQVQKYFDVSLAEFKEFWASLSDQEKDEIKLQVAELT